MKFRAYDRRAALPLFGVTLAFLAAGLIPGPSPCSADGGANHRVRNLHFGVSGGNVRDITRFFCCSGTLGSLVTDGATQLHP